MKTSVQARLFIEDAPVDRLAAKPSTIENSMLAPIERITELHPRSTFFPAFRFPAYVLLLQKADRADFSYADDS